MTPRDKLIAARVRLQTDQPFFSYLTMGLNLIEVNDKAEMPTAGVDAKGNLYYNPEFINSLTKQECKTLLCHEVLHVALLHLSRYNNRDPEIGNIAADIIVNNLLQLNKFEFSGEMVKKGILLPQDNTFTIAGTTITNLDKRFFEEVYDIIEDLLKKNLIKIYVDSQGNTFVKDKNGSYRQFDVHKLSKPVEGETKEQKEAREAIENQWKKRLSEAFMYSKQQGKEPGSMERHIEDLLNTKMNWKEMLRKFITMQIPHDFTYSRPSKRSISTGYYMPSVVKDNALEIVIAVDTSGSIEEEELKEFLTEVYGIGKSFAQIKMNLIFWDTKMQAHYTLDQNDISDLLSFKAKGGGGTDFKGMHEYISEHIPYTKILVVLTDGYADFDSKPDFNVMFVLSKKSNQLENIPDYGQKVKLE